MPSERECATKQQRQWRNGAVAVALRVGTHLELDPSLRVWQDVAISVEHFAPRILWQLVGVLLVVRERLETVTVLRSKIVLLANVVRTSSEKEEG